MTVTKEQVDEGMKQLTKLSVVIPALVEVRNTLSEYIDQVRYEEFERNNKKTAEEFERSIEINNLDY